MASGLVVSPMVDTLIKTLGSAIWKELGLLWGVKDDIKRLQRLLSNVYSVLDDAERRSRSIDDGAVRKWLKDLKDTAFDADDVLDEFQTEAIRRRMDMRNPMMEKVNRFFSSGNSIAFRFKMSRKIKKLVGRFDEIAEAKAKFHLVERYNTVQHCERETFSFVVESEIFGRNDDKAKLMEWLTDGENDNKDVSILPVVGLGGVGKTTLAQLVYNDEKVKKHFKLQMWVCVGEDFDGKAIAKAILECATKEQCLLSGLEDIHQLLKEKLNEKKYLLVLDDVWNEDALKWERLKLILGGNMEGSKIIVTTRSQRVAEISGTTGSSYKMTVLSDDDNWVIFKNRAFGLGREQETPNLVLIGKEIVKKCGGLPLAAKSLGSLMATKRGEAEWSSVKNSEVWRLGEGNKDILPALQLSYDHLSAQLKRCFAYCSVFPKDFRIKKLKLIQLWVAEGLVQSEEGTHVEDIGNQYFNMLHWRSFFQEEREDEFVGVVSCKMHDLVHDLASFVAKDEFCRVEDGLQSSFPSGCRYLSVSFHGGLLSPTIVENLKEARKLRSLFFFGSFNSKGRGERALWDVISSLTNLRVLYLSDCHIYTVDHCVGKLKHLRFLDLSDSQVKLLPVSITNLYNMQTLNLRQCHKLQELPRSIQSMSYLRHLDIAGRIPLQSLNRKPCGVYKLRRLKRMPSGLNRLTNLQTLPLFMVGEKSGQLTIGDMQHLNHIKGEVTIYGLENVKDPKDAMKAQLRSKVDLCCLGLCWERSGEEALVGDILENLQPPPSLKYLRIEGYGGSGFPNWLTNGDLFSLFNNLVELVLLSLDRCECLPPLGQLPSLKRLTLSHMKSIMKIGEELYGGKSDIAFSSLKYLALGPASSLEEWSVLKGEMFPCLETLRIDGCPKLTIQPCMPSSIVELFIDDSNEELLAAGEGCCLQGLSNLRNLNIWVMNASKTGWKGLQCLTNLEKMEVVFCHDLKWLPDGIMQLYLPSLRTLKIHDSLKSLGNSVQPPPFFMSLHHLTLTYCKHLTALPNWLSGLTSLESLKLRSCDKLEMLPDGFEHLTGLKKLTVKWSPILEKRCERETGEDWHKISHIPNIRIMPIPLEVLNF